MMMKLIAELTEDRISKDGIKWLVIESDEFDTGGYFLFFHKSLDEPSEADLWFATVEAAQRQAALNYAVEQEDWRPQDS